ncbi:MAG: methyltransferase domain-containing protein [Chitinivibrionales bacterium]|nr:methyltransferase domain-containing protein [Chitinivibrionales bacterium]
MPATLKRYDITFPEISGLSQDKEWVLFDDGECKRKVRLHNYDEIYQVPGLYEEIFYNSLQCCSPRVIVSMLKEEMAREGADPKNLSVLDFGAGNGIVGEELRKIGVSRVVGADIIPEACEAAYRDRPGVYHDYAVMDLSQMDVFTTKSLLTHKFNSLITVAALGFGDIPTQAFINAFNLVEDGGWIAFNIKETFLSDKDFTGFKDLLHTNLDTSISICASKNYCHRLSITGKKLHYAAVIGRKVSDMKMNDRNN